MSTDLMDKLTEVGQLNDEWSEPQLSEGRPPLYVMAGHEATPPTRRLLPGAIAALVLVAVVAGSMIANGNDDTDDEVNTVAETDALQEASPPPIPSEWPTTHADSLTGVTPDGLTWSVEVEAGTWEVCHQLGNHTGCGSAQVHPVQISEGSGGDVLVFGVVMPGMTDSEGDTITGPADRVEFQLSDGSWVEAQHVGDRLWVGFVPSITRLRASLIYHWGDTSMRVSTAPDDRALPHEVGASTEEERQATEAAARRRAAEFQRQAEAERQAELQRDG